MSRPYLEFDDDDLDFMNEKGWARNPEHPYRVSEYWTSLNECYSAPTIESAADIVVNLLNEAYGVKLYARNGAGEWRMILAINGSEIGFSRWDDKDDSKTNLIKTHVSLMLELVKENQ